MLEDPRKTGLKNGLKQLSLKELYRVLNYKDEILLDEFNYKDGRFCPLAIAVGLDKIMENPTNEKVVALLEKMGYTVYNTRGISGDFYTTNRYKDLIEAVKEVILEKENISNQPPPCL